MDAKGLTEYLWDVLYWSWGCLFGATFLGDWTWWFWAAIPVYSAWLAWTTYSGMRGGFGGMMGQDGAGANGQAASESKRQTKIEKRGGQKISYR